MTDLEIPETGAVFTFGKSRFADNKPSHFFIKNDPVVHIACGDEHTAVICKNGRIFAFGSNEWGQLGLGHNNMIHKPSCMKALKPEKAKFIACGRAHTVILTESNEIYACGSNTDGQLGLDNIDMVNTPTKLSCTQLKEQGAIKKLSAGSQHTLALTETGLVFVWGSNSEGQLGLENNKPNSRIPVLLEFKDKIRDISCGYYHTAILTESGDLYTFGENEQGKLGLNQTMENNVYKPAKVNIGVPLVSVTCGGNHNFGLTADGRAVAFGSNVNGELAVEKELSWISKPQTLQPELFRNEKLIMIACGENHSAFITETYKIYSCGDPRHGKLCQDQSETGQFEPLQRFQNYKVTNVACGGCHTIICAQKLTNDKPLPPLQRIPNLIRNNTNETHESENSNGMITKMNGFNNDEQQENDLLIDSLDEPKVEQNSDLINTTLKDDLDSEYEKVVNQLKNEREQVGNKLKESKENFVIEMKGLKENLIQGIESEDNLLREIEDDSRSSKTNSETISVDEKQLNEEPKTPADNDDDKDLKTEQPSEQNEKKLTRLFSTFKRKKINTNTTLSTKVFEHKNSEGKNSDDIQNADSDIKVEKIKACILL